MNPKVIPIQAHQDNCRLFKAVVNNVSKQGLFIDYASAVINVQVAFSCLVTPIEGDTVLVNQSGSDYFVLSVLEREADQDIALNFPANVKLTALDGQVNVVSGKDINLFSTAKTNLVSADINMTSKEMNLSTGKLTAHTTEIESHSKTVKLYALLLSSVTKQVIQKADTVIRKVEQVETLNIGSLIQIIRKNYTSHSNQAVITASKDVRIDGERIHMG
jgi:hypothetical protein